jgi:hypothetical protein
MSDESSNKDKEKAVGSDARTALGEPFWEWSAKYAITASLMIVLLGIAYCCCCGIPYYIACNKHRQKKLMAVFAKSKKKKGARLHGSSGANATGDKASPIKSPVIATEYMGGEADVLEANRYNAFS